MNQGLNQISALLIMPLDFHARFGASPSCHAEMTSAIGALRVKFRYFVVLVNDGRRPSQAVFIPTKYISLVIAFSAGASWQTGTSQGALVRLRALRTIWPVRRHQTGSNGPAFDASPIANGGFQIPLAYRLDDSNANQNLVITKLRLPTRRGRPSFGDWWSKAALFMGRAVRCQ